MDILQWHMPRQEARVEFVDNVLSDWTARSIMLEVKCAVCVLSENLGQEDQLRNHWHKVITQVAPTAVKHWMGDKREQCR